MKREREVHMESIVVVAVFIVCALLAARYIVKIFTGRQTGCACGDDAGSGFMPARCMKQKQACLECTEPRSETTENAG